MATFPGTEFVYGECPFVLHLQPQPPQPGDVLPGGSTHAMARDPRRPGPFTPPPAEVWCRGNSDVFDSGLAL